MALSLSIPTTYPTTARATNNSNLQFQFLKSWVQSKRIVITKCESKESSAETELAAKGTKLGIGSPIIVIEAPKMLKTAASVPCLRANSGLVKAGDVGRIMSRKPKDVWAVRLSNGSYLLDGKYLKPLEIDE